VDPLSRENDIPDCPPTAITLPSSEHVMQLPSSTGHPLNVHANRPFVEIQIAPAPTAKLLCPSEDKASPVHELDGAVVRLHMPPKLVEIQIPPLSIAATTVAPFVEHAIDCHEDMGASLRCQFVPEFVE
jgi:hypothetical protein